MTKETKYIIDQIIKEQQEQKDNGPIDMTVDQLWKYSGKVEEYTNEYKSLINEGYERIKTKRWIKPSRKEYFRTYWLRNKDKYKKL
jgi:hypothetical protein